MPKFPFLSAQWIDAARAIHEDPSVDAGPAGASVRMNLVVEEVPFDTSTIEAHLDTSEGAFELGIGHLSSADVKVSLDYPTAKAILVDGDGAAAMSAFMAGKIRVEGDMGKLLAFQSTPPTGAALAAAERIREITA
jgi:putative sterol carrier protein